jgi:uncharacterized phage protein (TIGR01671 family)
MREILFRGKTEKGKWIEGDLYQSRLKSIFMISYYTEYGNRMTEVVNPETVGQYTGLTDKNGTKIFEGDILEVDVQEYEEAPDDWIYQFLGSSSHKRYTGRKIKALWSVEYKEHRCRGNGFYVYGKDRRFNTTLTQSTIFNSNPVVIGNIHDNPELLKGE